MRRQGKTIAEMLYENDSNIMKTLDLAKIKKNQVSVAQFARKRAIASTPPIPQFTNTLSQSSDEINNKINGQHSDRDVSLDQLREEYRATGKELQDVRNQIRAINNSEEMNRRIKEVMESEDEKAAQEEFKAWTKEIGLDDLVAREKELSADYNRLYKQYEKAQEEADAAAEREAIEKSGKSEADYFRDLAVKEFGYTPYFYDAGYLLPNGKLLNFSGEKGRHYGRRGQDHRAIGSIFANDSGSQAMLRFMGQGNIRVMAETPGLDISKDVEPTKEQYAAIRRFAAEKAREEYFSVDLTDEYGNTIGTLEYDGRIRPDRVVNDIKNYFQTGEIREQGLSAFYSEREQSYVIRYGERSKGGGQEYKATEEAYRFWEESRRADLWKYDDSSRKDMLGPVMAFYKKYQHGVADKNTFFGNTIAVFQPAYRPKRAPDYISRTREGDVSSEYWYTADGVIRGSSHWGEVSSCNWFLSGRYTGKKQYGKASWTDFVQKADIVIQDGKAVLSSFDNTVGIEKRGHGFASFKVSDDVFAKMSDRDKNDSHHRRQAVESLLGTLYNDRSLNPNTASEIAAFNRSFSNKTRGIRKGKERAVFITTGGHWYAVRADGYMSGEILAKVPIGENREYISDLRRRYSDAINKRGRAVSGSDGQNRADRGRNGRRDVDVEDERATGRVSSLDVSERGYGDIAGYVDESYGYQDEEELIEAVRNGAIALLGDGTVLTKDDVDFSERDTADVQKQQAKDRAKLKQKFDVYKLLEENADLKEENKDLEKSKRNLEKLTKVLEKRLEYWKRQSKRSDYARINERDTDRLAAQILREYGSNYRTMRRKYLSS